MAFVDDVVITVKAGNGGNGATVTKQLFGSKKTAPDGGNGGFGGSVYFKADSNISDLAEFKFKKKIRGIDGIAGGRKDLDGRNAEDITVLVPFGTTITDEKTTEHVELTTDLPFCVARGGVGGEGNHDFNPAIAKFKARQQAGELGEERTLHLVLKLIADIGLVGLPNAGKSSLLKVLTNATPKIGNYAFTTLEPNLGVFGKLVIADIPGLIEGASKGRGLGIKFLKHISKTSTLLHCIDANEEDVLSVYQTVRDEFKSYDSSLLSKREIILLTKIDLVDPAKVKRDLAALKKLKLEAIAISIYQEESVVKLKKLLSSL